MSFNFENLNSEIRELMLQEVNSDIGSNKLYYSKQFSEHGKTIYPDLLKAAVTKGDDVSLTDSLNNCFLQSTSRRTKNGITVVKVKKDAPASFSEGEFNRFYIRALSIYAIHHKKRLVIYRAKSVAIARPESESKIGSLIDPNKLLSDLRDNIGVDTALGVPGGVNSGLSVRL